MRTTTRLVTALLAVALAATACGGDDDTADTATGEGTEATATGDATGGDTAASGDPIPIGAIFDRTGATSDVGGPYGDGAVAYVEWLNENGGVDGRPIDLSHADYAYDVAQAEQLYSDYVSQGVVAFSGWGTGDTEALRPKITSDELPFISGSYSEELRDPAETPYNFVVALTYSDQIRIALDYIASQNEGVSLDVAVFHNDSPFGLSPVEDGRAYIEENGWDFTYDNYAMPSGAADYFGQLSQAEGADYIIIQNVSSPAAQLASNVAAQGMDATIVCLNWCADEGFIELAGDAAEGSLGVPPWAPPTTAEGDISAVTSWLEDNGQSLEDINLHFTQGWYQTSVLVEAIRKVIADGQEVTGPNIKTALEEMDPVETPVSTPIEFSAEDHAGMDSGRVYEVQDGAWVPVSDPITP
jgi:branched-chain amino acid transport system substrate-binding protein